MIQTIKIFCCDCDCDVSARLTNGKEIYPHRPDLYHLPFWKCDTCRNYVGCHWKTKKPTTPLGIIPTEELRQARRKIHAILDPLWQSNGMDRKELYGIITGKIGWTFHTAKLRTVREAREVYRIIQEIKRERVEKAA